MMNCPKCGHKQNDNLSECTKCGVIFEKYKKIDVPENEARAADEIESTDRIFTKLWKYPIIVLVLLCLLCLLFPERALLVRPLSIYLFFGIPALFFAIAGIINLITGMILYRNEEDGWRPIHLTAGLFLNGLMIILTLSVGIGDYNLRLSKKRYKTAVDQIQQNRYFIMDYLSDPSNIYPAENDSLETLRSRVPYRYRKDVFLTDPWDRPYGFRLEEGSPYVWSHGPDGLLGTSDDIDSNSRPFRWHYYHWPAA